MKRITLESIQQLPQLKQPMIITNPHATCTANNKHSHEFNQTCAEFMRCIHCDGVLDIHKFDK
jgi:hypothetical protein